nr:piggyBac transposable element-derived protein 4 [Parasteatoda tepidariorum]
MPRRGRPLTQDEIHKIMNDFDDETYADSESECEEEEEKNEVDEIDSEDESMDNCQSNSATSNLKAVERVFQWKEPSFDDKVNVLPFTGNVGLNEKHKDLKSEVEFFELFFSDKLFKILSDETNRYADQIMDARPESSGNRKHQASWVPTNPGEIKKFLGIIMLMGHVDLDNILHYWSTDELVSTPLVSKCMPRDRFMLILKFLHFSGNSLKNTIMMKTMIAYGN